MSVTLEELTQILYKAKQQASTAAERQMLDRLSHDINDAMMRHSVGILPREQFLSGTVRSNNLEEPEPTPLHSLSRTLDGLRAARGSITGVLELDEEQRNHAVDLVYETANIIAEVSEFLDAHVDENFNVLDLANEYRDMVRGENEHYEGDE